MDFGYLGDSVSVKCEKDESAEVEKDSVNLVTMELSRQMKTLTLEAVSCYLSYSIYRWDTVV